MRKQTHPTRVLFLTAGVLGTATQAKALEASDILAYNLGPVSIRPHLTVAEQFTDNLFYSSQNQKSDFITMVDPNIELRLGHPGGQDQVRMVYQLNSLNYAENSSNNALDHTLRLDTDFAGSKLSTSGRDQVEYLNSIYGGYVTLIQGNSTVSTLGAVKLERVLYDLDQKLSYSFTEKTQAYVDGSYDVTSFLTPVFLNDVQVLRGTGGFSYQVTPKTKVFGEIYASQFASGPNEPSVAKGSHLDLYGGYIGAEGTFTPKLTGSVKAGYEESAFADGSPGSSIPVVEAALSYQITDFSQAKLTYSRRTVISITSARVALGRDAIGLNFNQSFGPARHFSLNVAGSVGLYDYGDLGLYRGRSDTYYNARVNLDYHFRLWLSAGVGYEYERFSSSDPAAIDYAVNRATVSVVIGY